MTGCQTCGGFGNRHDPIAHGAELVADCEVCGLAIAAADYCDGCREDPDEYAPRHAKCCEDDL